MPKGGPDELNPFHVVTKANSIYSSGITGGRRFGSPHSYGGEVWLPTSGLRSPVHGKILAAGDNGYWRLSTFGSGQQYPYSWHFDNNGEIYLTVSYPPSRGYSVRCVRE